MIPAITFAIQNVILPIIIAYGVLWIDQQWHGKMEYNRAFYRSVSLGVNSKKHPEKFTLEALFIASEAELEYACGLMNKEFKQAVREVEEAIAEQLWNERLGPPVPPKNQQI